MVQAKRKYKMAGHTKFNNKRTGAKVSFMFAGFGIEYLIKGEDEQI